MNYQKSKWLKIKPIAHRGLHNNDKGIPENSILSFLKAVEKKIPIEIDVQLTLDKEIVVFHDCDLNRMCGINKKISELSLQELKKQTLSRSNEYIPSLDEVLKIVNGQIPILIEIKNEGKVGELEKILALKLDKYDGDIAIQAFNPFVLNWFRKNRPKIMRGLLTSNFNEIQMPWILKFILRNMLLNFIAKPDFLGVEISAVSEKRFVKFRKRKIPILAWTIVDEIQREKAIKECDNYIFEHITIDK